MNQPQAPSGSDRNPLIEPDGFRVWRPGLVKYRDAQARQVDLVDQRRHWPHDLLILLEHPPVITFGRKTDQNNLLWDQRTLQAAGIDCVPSHRGGDITLHSPGQLVGYPIVDLNHYRKDLHRYLRQTGRSADLHACRFRLGRRSCVGQNRRMGRRAQNCFNRHSRTALDKLSWLCSEHR